MHAEIYTKSGCPWCVKAKELLESKNVKYTEYKVGENGITKQTIQERVGSNVAIHTVPQIFLDGKYIGGCTDLIDYFNKGN